MKSIIIIIFAVFAIPTYAQTFSNSLVLVMPEDGQEQYSISISGKEVCNDCFKNKDKFVFNSIYSNILNVKITSGNLVFHDNVILTLKTNNLQEPFKAVYKIVRKRKKIVLKKIAITPKIVPQPIPQ